MRTKTLEITWEATSSAKNHTDKTVGEIDKVKWRVIDKLSTIARIHEYLGKLKAAHRTKSNQDNVIIIWDTDVKIAVLLEYWVQIINSIIAKRETTEDWKKQIKVIIQLFDNIDDLRIRITLIANYWWDLSPQQIFEKVVAIKLFEDDWLHID